jgi:hypothetical protein
MLTTIVFLIIACAFPYNEHLDPVYEYCYHTFDQAHAYRREYLVSKRKSGKSSAPQKGRRSQRGGGAVSTVMEQSAATREQYQHARTHTDITSLPVNSPVRRSAETFLSALEQRTGGEAAARSATIKKLGEPEMLRTFGPVSPMQLMQGIKLAKSLLRPAN